MKKELFIFAIFILLIFICGMCVFAAPVNDKYENAVITTLNEPLIEMEGTTFGATKELAEPYHARNAGGNSVWYRIVPQEAAVLRIHIRATSFGNYFNTLLAVYKGTNPSDFSLVAENDDMGYNLPLSDLTLTVKPGNMYYVAVDGHRDDFGNIASGFFRIRFEKLNVPMNDLPDVSPQMSFPSARTTNFTGGTNRNATKDPGEPNLTTNAGGKSVWYAWEAPVSRAMTVKLSCNPFVQECFDMQLGVFKSGWNNKIASNDNYENNSEVSVASFYAEAGETYGFGVDGIRAAEGTVSEGNFIIEFYPTFYRYETNFDTTDRKTDLTVFRPSDGNWYSLRSSNGQASIVNFGLPGDTPVQADYDGDAITDYAVVRDTPQGKLWYFQNSADNSVSVIPFGLQGDKVLAGDYDADGRADMAAVRPTAQGLIWYIRPSSSPNNIKVYNFGISTDQPVIGDFVKGAEVIGGGFAIDLAVVRTEANGKKVWHVQSTSGTNYKQMQFGLASDINVPADYDGDGYTDIAVWRPSSGTWYIFDESANSVLVRQWGTNGDIPQPIQFDNGGALDLAVFRPSTGVWWIKNNVGVGLVSTVKWGISGDKPVSALTSLMNP